MKKMNTHHHGYTCAQAWELSIVVFKTIYLTRLSNQAGFLVFEVK